MFTHTHTRYASTRRVLHVVYTTLVQTQVGEDRQSPLGHAPCFALRPLSTQVRVRTARGLFLPM